MLARRTGFIFIHMPDDSSWLPGTIGQCLSRTLLTHAGLDTLIHHHVGLNSLCATDDGRLGFRMYDLTSELILNCKLS